MSETCRVLWQNKIGIISETDWLFKKKSITMLGNMNVNYTSSFPKILCWFFLHGEALFLQNCTEHCIELRIVTYMRH